MYELLVRQRSIIYRDQPGPFRARGGPAVERARGAGGAGSGMHSRHATHTNYSTRVPRHIVAAWFQDDSHDK
eukprot:COSAG02_NODE_208_length_29027_cov_27.870230_12_plen_72_part_00